MSDRGFSLLVLAGITLSLVGPPLLAIVFREPLFLLLWVFALAGGFI